MVSQNSYDSFLLSFLPQLTTYPNVQTTMNLKFGITAFSAAVSFSVQYTIFNSLATKCFNFICKLVAFQNFSANMQLCATPMFLCHHTTFGLFILMDYLKYESHFIHLKNSITPLKKKQKLKINTLSLSHTHTVLF